MGRFNHRNSDDRKRRPTGSNPELDFQQIPEDIRLPAFNVSDGEKRDLDGTALDGEPPSEQSVGFIRIGAIAPWFGAKRKLAPVIVEELGKHKGYWEPFCGSLAVLLAKPPCSQETVSDLHGDLTNLAWVLAAPRLAAELYDRLGRVMFSDAIFEHARDVLSNQTVPDTVDLDRAYWYFLFSWMGSNGVAGTKRALDASLAVRFTNGGGAPTVRFRSTVESIPAWHYRLCNVVILRRSAFDLLEQIEDSRDTAIYIDSPYLFETRSKGAASESGAQYVHDFDEPQAGLFAGKADRHELLAERLRRFKEARVVVSYYDHPRLHEMYAGWTFRDCSINKGIASQNRRGVQGRVEAPEILILNGHSFSKNLG
jgi:DNA adenine methylase